jgi:Dolichyl-phosphate-mannose-protein mannosyltransferase
MPVGWKWIAGTALLVSTINFVTMPAEEYFGDGIAVRVETVGLITSGRWSVPSEIAHEWGEPGQYFYENAEGAFYPKYGILNTLTFVPALWIEKIVSGNLSLYSDNLVSLNLFNIVLSCASAIYLSLLARRFTQSKLAMSIFVVASLYCTFWWNYLRAQTLEIYLTLFFIAFYYHFVSALSSEKRTLRNQQFFIAAILLGLLCLSKTVFLVFVPVAALFFALDQSRTRERRLGDNLAFWWLPLSIFIVVLLTTNWLKFGSPFASGYTQWGQESHPFTLNIWPGIVGLVVGKQGSAFLHFPVLLPGMIGWPIFFKKHRREAQLMLMFAAVWFLVTAAFTNWKGASCYGPRYLLPMLPLLTLPFLNFLDWVRTLTSRTWKLIVEIAVGVVLSYSLLLQIGVNSLPFFFCYDLAEIVTEHPHGRAALYLKSHHFGTINLDFLQYASGRRSRFQTDFMGQLTFDEFVTVEGLIAEMKLNYFWFNKSPEVAADSPRR